jgi:ABC-type multidrug transport system permease subunit
MINRLTFYNIILFIIGVLLILWGVILTAFILNGFLFVIAYLMIIIGFFGIEMVSLQLALTTFLNIDNRGVWKFE